MNKYIVALCIGGLMEQPEFTYDNYQLIEAEDELLAKKKYDKVNSCNFFYGSTMAGLENGELIIYNDETPMKYIKLLQED